MQPLCVAERDAHEKGVRHERGEVVDGKGLKLKSLPAWESRLAPKVLLLGVGWPVCVNRSLGQKPVLPDMDNDMSQTTRMEGLAKLRRSYARAGLNYSGQLLDQAMALLG
jgi:hypothetical protein